MQLGKSTRILTNRNVYFIHLGCGVVIREEHRVVPLAPLGSAHGCFDNFSMDVRLDVGTVTHWEPVTHKLCRLFTSHALPYHPRDRHCADLLVFECRRT